MIDVDLLIFDVDGTLIDSRRDIVNAVVFTLDKMGLPKKGFSEIVSYIGKGVRYLILESIGGEERLLGRATEVFTDYYVNHSADTTTVYPGVIDTMEYFRHKKKVIVTNRNKAFAELTLKLLNLKGYFEEISGGDEISCAKPDSCPIDNILGRFKVSNRKAIMIGDMDLDVLSGRSAGVYTCAVTYGIGKKEDIIKSGPDFLIDDIRELKKIAR